MEKQSRQSKNISGILPIIKPKGITSSKALLRVKRHFNFTKAGHSGTLDPMATGVLIILLGGATKIMPYIKHWDKEYIAKAHLGIRTDSDDSEGEIIEEKIVKPFDQNNLKKTFNIFQGAFDQLPPAFSAKKIDGKRAYSYAREGLTPLLKKSRVTVEEIEILSYEHPILEFRVKCSAGTYIRSICRDLGEMLGCGAHMCSLVRTRNGQFNINDSLEIDNMENLNNDYIDKLKMLQGSYLEFPECSLKVDFDSISRGGGNIEKRSFLDSGRQYRFKKGELLSITSHNGNLLGVFESCVDRGLYDEAKDSSCVLRAKRLFN